MDLAKSPQIHILQVSGYEFRCKYYNYFSNYILHILVLLQSRQSIKDAKIDKEKEGKFKRKI